MPVFLTQARRCRSATVAVIADTADEAKQFVANKMEDPNWPEDEDTINGYSTFDWSMNHGPAGRQRKLPRGITYFDASGTTPAPTRKDMVRNARKAVRKES